MQKSGNGSLGDIWPHTSDCVRSFALTQHQIGRVLRRRKDSERDRLLIEIVSTIQTETLTEFDAKAPNSLKITNEFFHELDILYSWLIPQPPFETA